MSNVKVAVRVRPLDRRELEQGARLVVEVQGEAISVQNPKLQGICSEYGDSRERIKHFHYDYAYWSVEPTSRNYATQEMIFQDLGTEVLEAAFDGYNACIFAYGQTGSGKTHTMMGYPPGQLGLIPRISEGLFRQMEEVMDEEDEERTSFRVVVSFLEIYNERVRDLLRPNGNKQKERYTLKVREHPRNGPFVEDLSQHTVKDKDKLQDLIERGNDNRTTAATHMHDRSSRSHAIFTITFTQAHLDEDLPSEKVSRLHLVDLAGSERADPTSRYNKGRLKEGANINKSLVTLGNVIQSLAERSLREWNQDSEYAMGSSMSLGSNSTSGSKESLASPCGSPRRRNMFIPYRDSVLTWLLKDSLGGNAKTIMVATISPSSLYYSETISTLRYAQRAKSIVNKPYVNEDPNVKLIRELRAEIVRLRTMLAAHWAGSLMSLSETSSGIAEKLEENEIKARELTKTWFDKWEETHEIIRDSDMRIRPFARRSNSMGVIVDSQLPHLVCMNDDILSTGVLLFHLREGVSTVGNDEATLETDIEVNGPGTVADHCTITHNDGDIWLDPGEGAYIMVNRKIITQPVYLSQGDIIFLGHNNMFRFNNPREAAKLREERKAECGNSQGSGTLSRCYSAGSISSLDVHSESISSDSPRSSLVRGPSWNDMCLDLERQNSSEAERIQAARDELAKLADEESILIETTTEMEEDIYRMHEQHLAEVEKQKHHLQALIEQHDRDHAEAQNVLEEMRRQLEQEGKNRQPTVRPEIHHIQEIEMSESVQGLYSSNDGLLVSSSHPVQEDVAMETEIYNCDRASASGIAASSHDTGLLGLADIYGADIFHLKDVLEGQRQEMVVAVAAVEEEWLQKDVELRERELEQMFLACQECLQLEKQKLKEKELQYKAAHAAQFQVIGTQTDSLEKLKHKQQQLQMYIDYKEKEMDPSGQRIEPLGESASDESLGSNIGAGRGRRKQQKALANALIHSPGEQAVHPKSPYSIFAVSETSSMGSSTHGESGLGAKPKEQSSHSSPTPFQTPFPKAKKTSIAEKVTARLYKSGPSKKRAESADSTTGKENSKKGPIHTRPKSAPLLPSKSPNTKKKKVPTATLR